jgi:hypothetical protein
MQGIKLRFTLPTAGVAATGWVKFNVPDTVPVMVALPAMGVVAFASIAKPQIYVVWPGKAGNVAVVALVVPVADAVIGPAAAGDAIASVRAIAALMLLIVLIIGISPYLPFFA